MATTSYVPVELYLRSSEYEPDAEYVDGHIEERPVGEYDHADWQTAILIWFRNHSKDWNVRVVPGQRVQVSRTRFRVPDVAVLDRAHPIEQIITRPPIAVFEVLSPEDTVRRMQRKLEDYAAMGIPQIWIVIPRLASFSGLRIRPSHQVRVLTNPRTTLRSTSPLFRLCFSGSVLGRDIAPGS